MLDVSLKIGELLVERGLIQESDLRKALHIQASGGGRLGAILVRIGALSEEVLLEETLSEQLDLPVLKTSDLPDDAAVYQCLQQSPISLDWFLDQKALLWPVSDEQYGCIAIDVLNNYLRDVIESRVGYGRVVYYLASQQVIESYLDYVQREYAVEDLFQSADESRALAELAEEAPIIEFVNNIMSQAKA